METGNYPNMGVARGKHRRGGVEQTDPGSFRRLLALPGGMGPASVVIREPHLPAQPRLTFREQLPL